jgi:glycosyltransferase involved in cell wall biosynthesis
MYLAGIAKQFFGADHGVVITNWDVSRLGWMAGRGLAPDLAQAYDPRYRNWDTWLYSPVDNFGPNHSSLNIEQCQALSDFTRVCAASEWGANVLKNSGRPDADWLPHGFDMKIFTIEPEARAKLGWSNDDIHVMSVMANQARKDFPAAFHAAALLKEKYGNRFRYHLHTNAMIHYWNVYALAADYGVNGCLEVTMEKGDRELAIRYSAADCCILPSGGEGFGMPIAESLACGTACVVTDYAAGQEIVEEECRVKPVAFRVDTVFNVQRAVLSGWGFARAAEEQIQKKRDDPWRSEYLRETVRHLGWDRLQYPWRRWLQQGLR